MDRKSIDIWMKERVSKLIKVTPPNPLLTQEGGLWDGTSALEEGRSFPPLKIRGG
jgi:hypothetical protein